MRYIVILVLFFSLNIFGNDFEENCKKCHFQERQLEMFMSRYTLKYSSEKRIKKAIFDYLKNPLEENSVMPQGFLRRWKVKEKTDLDDKILKKSIDIYYERYNLKRLLN